MTLTFRNLDIDPLDPVETWGFEGLLTAVERGDFRDWRRIAQALRRDPRGKVASELREVIDSVENPAMANLFSDVLRDAMAGQEAEERRAVVRDLQRALDASGLTRAQFASRLGTSQSRLSTYLSGKVVPAATILVRARRLAEARATS
ncbi:helix-turn-helix domain-containing protein [Sinomonas sp. G460-2]|uniref:helix-turn-helix domain-containing protein n=1 Tax=Sinomonas sp. G460-2 TaxID=3393464 RepID=UPI0039EF16AB